MRFDVRREERSVEDELGRASRRGRNYVSAPEEGGATERERESAAGKVMTGGCGGWGGLTRHEVRGQKGNWRKERKMETRRGGGEGRDLKGRGEWRGQPGQV